MRRFSSEVWDLERRIQTREPMLNMCRQQQAEKLHVKIVSSKTLRKEYRSTCAIIDLGSLYSYPMYIYQPDYSVFSQSYALAGCAF